MEEMDYLDHLVHRVQEEMMDFLVSQVRKEMLLLPFLVPVDPKEMLDCLVKMEILVYQVVLDHQVHLATQDYQDSKE